MDKLFKLKEHNTTIKTELMAGLTTFIAMSYVLLVTPGIFAELGVVSYGAIYIATALSAVIGTLLVGIIANLPLAQASGLGLSAFFVYTVCLNLEFSYANTLLFVLVDGVIFIIFTLTGVREYAFKAIPNTIKSAIPAGIGLFIAFLGLQDSKLLINNSASNSYASITIYRLPNISTWEDMMPLVVTVVTFIFIILLDKKGIKGSILWGIFIGTMAYYFLGFTIPNFYNDFSLIVMNPFDAFGEFIKFSFGKVFTQGFDFSKYLENHSIATLITTFITTIIAFCLVDMFDTMGTLFGACKAGNMLISNKDGDKIVPNMNRAMLCDAIATCIGSVCGISTVTTFVEASSGVAVGGRTGLSAMMTSGMFFIAMFLSPITALIPTCAYSAILIYVGILMMKSLSEINWKNFEISLPSFMTIIMMPLFSNISCGIAFGLMAYIMIKFVTKKAKEIAIGTWIIAILFIAMFVFAR